MKKFLRRSQEKAWRTVHESFLLIDKTIIELDFANIVICQCLADQLFASAFGIGK